MVSDRAWGCPSSRSAGGCPSRHVLQKSQSVLADKSISPLALVLQISHPKTGKTAERGTFHRTATDRVPSTQSHTQTHSCGRACGCILGHWGATHRVAGADQSNSGTSSGTDHRTTGDAMMGEPADQGTGCSANPGSDCG